MSQEWKYKEQQRFFLKGKKCVHVTKWLFSFCSLRHLLVLVLAIQIVVTESHINILLKMKNFIYYKYIN